MSPRGAAFAALALLLAAGCSQPALPPPPPMILFGIDGADWDRAIPLMRQGKLPAFERLARSGARRTLLSLEPERLSPTIWTTVATGVLPEKHGIFHFVERGADGTVAPITANQRKVGALWNIFTARGLSVGVIGWLATWPAEPVKGFLVSSYTPFVFDWGAAKPLKGTIVEGVPNQVWPPELQDELENLKVAPGDVTQPDLERRFGLGIVPPMPSEDARESLDGMRWSWAADETYRRVRRRLHADPPGGERPRLELLYYGTVDVVSHRFWKYMEPSTYLQGDVDPEEARLYGEAIEGAYRSLDETLSEVVGAESEPIRILVLSDHGFRENQDPKRTTSSGWHRRQGIFVAAGPDFVEGALLSPGSVVDVAPTVLYAAGLPVADDMDGRPSLDLFRPEFSVAHEVGRIASYEPEVARVRSESPVASPVDEEILTRLKALGYIQ